MKDDFVIALTGEIQLRSDYLNPDTQIETIYFGGGTPSILDQKDLETLFNALHKHFKISTDAEITLEANPDDLTDEKLSMLSRTPVNRLSIGIQSFDDQELKWMNRVHHAQMAIDCVNDAATAGFTNLSVDLIYGSPLLTNENWIKTLETVFKLPVQHLSCYSLTVEEKTPLAALIEKGEKLAPSESKSAEQFKILMDLTSVNNFEQYEISNFCRNEKYSRHNSSYWKGVHYIGLGPSAHSFNGVSRQWNKANNAIYITQVNQGILPFEIELLTAQDLYNEYIMTALRTKWGISRSYISETCGAFFENHFIKNLFPYLDNKQIIQNEGMYYLSNDGKFFADRIASCLFYIDS